MTVNRLSIHFMVLSLLLVGGCIILPVGHSTYGKVISDEDLTFIELSVTTKSEIVERLGEGLSFEAQNVLAYYWATETKFFFGMPPIRTSHAETRIYRQDYALYIEFDYNDRVRRFQPMMIPKNGLSVMEWLDRE